MILNWLGLRASLYSRDSRRGGDRVTDRIQVSLMCYLAAANAHAFEFDAQLHVPIVDPDGLLGHLHITVLILAK